jgi:pyruvate kinase
MTQTIRSTVEPPAQTYRARAHTKVVATIGPASEPLISELIDAGMSVARINFSHDSHDDHRRRIEAIRREARKQRRAVGILADIQGPKMRLGLVEGGWRDLTEGERYKLLEGKGMAADDEIRFNLEGFQVSVEPGHRLFLNDGVVELIAEERVDGVLMGRVVRGGPIGDRKGVHLPDSDLDIELPTEKDLRDLELINELEVDMVGVSFVKDAADVARVRQLAPLAQIIAKIERQAALDNLDGILGEADGIMVARGDLGVEIDMAQLPMVQKSLIQAAGRAGRFTITATEMLESMVKATRPTRAEVTDVANAVLDGTDAVMLSGETAMGDHPVEAVSTMHSIAEAVETSQRYHDLPRVRFRQSEPTFSNATAHAAADAAESLGLTKILCFTETGNTVRQISRYRPSAVIIGLTPHERTFNAMTILHHVRPMMCPSEENLEEMLRKAVQLLLGRGMVQMGEEVVFVAGVPPKRARSTNMMKLHRVGELAKLA